MSNTYDYYEKRLKIPPEIISVEQALERAGNGHNYQKRVILYIFLQIFFITFLILSNQVLFPSFDIQCSSSRNQTLIFQKEKYCSSNLNDLFKISMPNISNIDANLEKKNVTSQNYSCNIKSKNASITRSVSESFSLLCAKEKFANYNSYHLKFLSWGIGFLISAYLQNISGRLQILKKSLFCTALFSLLLVFSFNVVMFTVLYFLLNVCAASFILTSFIYISEITSQNLRPISIFLLLMSFGTGPIALSFLNNFFTYWRIIALLATCLPILLLFIYMRIMVDSPRFLNVAKNFRDAKIALSNMALINDRMNEMSKEREFKFEEEVKSQEMQENLAKILKIEEINTKPNEHGFMSLFTYNSVRVRTFIFIYFWAVFSLGYSASFFMMNNLMENVLVNTAILGCLKIVGFLVGGYLILNVLRKVILKNILLVEGLINILFVVLVNSDPNEFTKLQRTIFNLLIFCSQIIFDAGFCLLIIYTIEVYPTVIRHFGLGFFLGVATFSALLANILIFMIKINGVGLLILIGFLCLLGIGIMNKLRETYDLGLKENLVEEEEALLNNDIMN